jgi:hypothetical protein
MNCPMQSNICPNEVLDSSTPLSNGPASLEAGLGLDWTILFSYKPRRQEKRIKSPKKDPDGSRHRWQIVQRLAM